MGAMTVIDNKIGIGRNVMKVMGRYNRILDKAIILLGKSGYTEGSYTDLYVNQFVSLYAHPGNKVLKEDHSQGEITGELTINEPATTTYAGMDVKVPSLVN